MNVRNEFDFNSKTRDATRDLSKSIDELEQSPLSEATDVCVSNLHTRVCVFLTPLLSLLSLLTPLTLL